MQELNRTNTIEDLAGDLVTAITTVERYVATTAPFNEEVESWINAELGGNDNGDDGDDDDDDNDDDEGEGSDNGSDTRRVAISVAIITLIVQCFLL